MKVNEKRSGSTSAAAGRKGQNGNSAKSIPGQRRELRLAELGVAAAAVAHELRQPLSAIQNLAAHTKAIIEPGEKAALRNLSLLEQQAELAGRILSDLLCFARSGKSRRRAANLHDILNEVLERAVLPPATKLQRKITPRLPRILADSLQVQCILTNLITNALESMQGRGALCICTRAERDHVAVRVSDTGCGIDATQAEHIFDAFYTTKRSGTGLGLALSRELAEANGGSIVFESRPGKGTTFELRLPRC